MVGVGLATYCFVRASNDRDNAVRAIEKQRLAEREGQSFSPEPSGLLPALAVLVWSFRRSRRRVHSNGRTTWT
jgi:hypothetical protein